MLSVFSDDHYMGEALKEAQKAREEGEVPVGAVIVCESQIIAKAYNQVERLTDPTAHAELLAITSASNYIGSKILEDCTLYVTLEPCPMCAGALFWSRIGKIVFGAADEKRGFSRVKPSLLHPSTALETGVRANECEQILNDFFKEIRK